MKSMFSGIVERTAEVVSIRTDRQNKDFTLRADFCKELKIDQSIAHNGVCLTDRKSTRLNSSHNA